MTTASGRARYEPRSSGGALCRPPDFTTFRTAPAIEAGGVSDREILPRLRSCPRPAEVAHAPLTAFIVSASAYELRTRRSDPDRHFGGGPTRFPKRLPSLVFRLRIRNG